jgi:hypothetical protein
MFELLRRRRSNALKKELLYTTPPHILERFSVLHDAQPEERGSKIPRPPLSYRVFRAARVFTDTLNEYFFGETPDKTSAWYFYGSLVTMFALIVAIVTFNVLV